MTELSYRWFCPPGGMVVDPFAGGSVRGIVASMLGLRYCGVDLSERQVLVNRMQAVDICDKENQPKWHAGDSLGIVKFVDMKADLLFSCPPYGALERYSDDPRDLSTMAYEDFILKYQNIITQAVKCLKNDRFAVFVVGDFRDSNGHLHNFVGDTISAFEDAGASFYNSAILITPAGTAPIRAAKYMDRSRKLVNCHQQFLCFVKGSWRRATVACGDLNRKLEQQQIDIELFGNGLLSDVSFSPSRQGNLSDKFLVPPFTVFDARDGWWRRRKTAWIGLGIESELGRGTDKLNLAIAVKRQREYDSPQELKEKERKRLMFGR